MVVVSLPVGNWGGVCGGDIFSNSILIVSLCLPYGLASTLSSGAEHVESRRTSD
jgi:hypothetical protein